jgi:hypothetical protein
LINTAYKNIAEKYFGLKHSRKQLRNRWDQMKDTDENYMPFSESSTSQEVAENTNLGDEEQNMNAFRDSIANGLLARRE